MKLIWIIIPMMFFGIISMQESFADETKIIFVSPDLVDCTGIAPQKCMQVRDDQNSEWLNFYGTIEGFTFVEGNSYQLLVKITDIENPPADASSKKYELLEIITDKSSSRHIPYNDMCAPGFVPLGEICVLNDRCGPGIYAGKVCVMDGIKQSYLKPSQQGNAGIAARNVICAEGLQLIFKHDASPVCVKPKSVNKLEDRGWYLEVPPIACTKEYLPVCGTDGVTYGNMCMLNAEHMGMNSKGECKAPEIQTVCTLDWSPVCGTDGVTYGNMCMLNGANMQLDHQGECTE